MSDFEKICPTAIVTTYPRTFTDISWEKAIYKWLEQNCFDRVDLRKELAPEIEARYKLINKLLDESKIKQVLELAAGYSSRGMIYSQKDYNYIEMDLKPIIDNKKQIVKALNQEHENLKLIEGNVLSKQAFAKAKLYIKNNEPLAIINEGLLRYLTFAEKAEVAKNIYDLLKVYGGIWLTCDVTPKKFITAQDKALPGFNDNLSKTSDRNNLPDRFADLDHVKDFFGKIGFRVTAVHKFSEVKNELASISEYHINSPEIEASLEDAIVVIMEINDKKV